MASMAIEKELLALEKRYWQAIKDKDAQTAIELSDEPCIVAGAQGVGRIDRKTMLAMMQSASYTLDRFELDEDVQVRMLRDDTAIVAYKVREELTVEGKPIKLEAADSSVWVRRDGRWLCALHTESIAGDPYGRDRQQKGSNLRAAPGAYATVRVTRRFKQSLQGVFDAWLDPEKVRHWMLAPSKDDKILAIEIVPRIGGSFSFRVLRGGQEIDHVGKYIEIERPRRLAFTWEAVTLPPAKPEAAENATVVRLDFIPDGTGTELRLTHERVPDDYASRTEAGWSTILDAIAASLDG